MAKILRPIYTMLFLLLLPFIFMRLWRKGSNLKDYRKRWQERLGYWPYPALESCVWIHAVSVGEAIAAAPVIQKFIQSNPACPVVVTTMTPTGSARVRDMFKHELNQTVFNVYVPYDLPWFIKRFIKHCRPKLFVAIETEIWPNLYHQLGKANIPLVIANGRLSPHSFKWYKRFKWVLSGVLKPVSYVAAQSKMDENRFIGIGVNSKKVSSTGNIKFDFEVKAAQIEQGKIIKQALNGQVLIAASTHEGEETIILSVYQKLLLKHPDLKLLLVPRHPDRFEKVYQLCTQSKLVVHRRSQQLPSEQTQIYLGDTMGEMMIFYAASDIAFVGGSLMPIGGHNLLEPASLCLPLLTGTHLFNFVQISQLLHEQSAVDIVKDSTELELSLERLLASKALREQRGQSAKFVVEQNRGALNRLWGILNLKHQAAS